MKRWKKILLCLLAVFILIIGALAVWQRNNISAFFLYLQNSPDKISDMVQEKREEAAQVLSKYDGITVSDLTPEQESAIMNGQMTVEEAIAAIGAGDEDEETAQEGKGSDEKSASGAENSEKKPVAGAGNSEKKPAATSQNDNQESAIINRYLKKVYAIKAEFLGRLAGIKESAASKFYALPEEEHTESRKKSIMADHVMQCYELENRCDVEINSVLASLKSELESIGASTQIVSEIRAAYENEKSVKKAYYLSLLS